MTYPELYERAVRKGDLREDEYSPFEFIDDINELGRQLWTIIFQGVNGNKPNEVRKETINIAGDLSYIHTRGIQKTPILKIVLDDCTIIKQRTDKVGNCYNSSGCDSLCMCTYEYDDEEIRFDEAPDGEYVIYYEAATYKPLTSALYSAGTSPDWLKDDFIPMFWKYAAYINSETVKENMLELYKFDRQQFEAYYSRTETIEMPMIQAEDSYNQL